MLKIYTNAMICTISIFQYAGKKRHVLMSLAIAQSLNSEVPTHMKNEPNRTQVMTQMRQTVLVLPFFFILNNQTPSLPKHT